MVWAGLIAVFLALLLAVVLESSLWAALTSIGELVGVLALFCLVCLWNCSLERRRTLPMMAEPTSAPSELGVTPKVSGHRPFRTHE